MRKISMKRKSKAELNSSAESENLDQEKIQTDEENDTSSAHENENSNKKSKKKNKRGRKPNSVNESNGTEEESAEEQYEVEAVLDQKTVKGAKHYLIRWKGYGADSDTWEPQSTVNCPELVAKFLASQKTPDSNKENKKRGSHANSKSPKKAILDDTDDEDANDEDFEPTQKTPESSKKNKKRGSLANNKSPKKAKVEESDNEDGSEEEFEVDRIIEVHHKKNGKREFLVHWKGYTMNENTWEPEENMSCPDLIEKFMTKVNRARESDTRELRVNRKPTKHFTLSMMQSGRRLSRRNLGKQRAQYKDVD